jgi:hypothetical protein
MSTDARDWQAPEVTPLTDDDGAAPEWARVRNGIEIISKV